MYFWKVQVESHFSPKSNEPRQNTKTDPGLRLMADKNILYIA